MFVWFQAQAMFLQLLQNDARLKKWPKIIQKYLSCFATPNSDTFYILTVTNIDIDIFPSSCRVIYVQPLKE